MRSSALFTIILVGSAVTASAEPKQEETSGRVSHIDKKQKKDDAPRRASDWVELASPTPAKHGTEFVVIGKEAGSFAKIRIDASKGRVNVRRVKVFFDGGGVKAVQLDRRLDDKRQKSALIDLGDLKAIDRIVVTTETHTNGEYAIYGSAGGGVVSTR